MTDAQFLAWIAAPWAMRCVLVEVGVNVGGAETTRYLSNRDYVTGPADTPANQVYLAVLSGGVRVDERLSIDGAASLTAGDIEIHNTGEFDGWLADVWTNRPVKVFVGDPRWGRGDFRQVFEGTVRQLDSRARNTLNIVLSDKLQRLNTPLSALKLGGSTENADRLIPLCFGECHNVSPLLVNPATLQYQVHAGPIEQIIEVRDNGVPVSYTADLANGKFTLAAQPAGAITASVQGDKTGGTYRNTVAALVQQIVTAYGKAADRFVTADLDAANLAAFAAAHPQPVGLYVAERMNVLEACAELARSVGAQLVMSRAGQLRLLKIALPAGGTPTAVGPDRMALRSLSSADRPAVKPAVKLGFCRNWTVQTGLQTGIPAAHKGLFEQEWLTVSAADAGVAALHRLEVEPEQENTALLVATDAQAEAARRLALWKTPRAVYAYQGTPDLMLETLGGGQVLTYPRFGLDSGVAGQIVGLSQDWAACRVGVEVLV